MFDFCVVVIGIILGAMIYLVYNFLFGEIIGLLIMISFIVAFSFVVYKRKVY